MIELKGVGFGGGNEIVTGRVSLNKVGKVGDVLVAEMTEPHLLPQMVKAVAVVTSQGGRMCHAAIICTELGIPFVVGVQGALDWLKNGMIISVNPLNGEVKEVSSE
jgi:pyruvate,water dikinase